MRIDFSAIERRFAAAGIPIHGFLDSQTADYTDNATPEHRNQGDAILSAWDWDAPPVPAEVSPLQAALALQAFGFLEDVEAAVAAGGVIAQLAWQRATVFRRDSQLLAQIAAAVPGMGEQLDDIFRAGAQISV